MPPALNVDPFDEIVDSTWFTNRNGRDRLPLEAVFRGPQTTEGPDASGPITVKSMRTMGVSPGFDIEDARGDTYILKFDPRENWEMASGAEVVTSNLLWAAGYNVPENYVYHLDSSKLVLHEELELEVVEGDSRVRYEIGAEDPRHELTREVFHRQVLSSYPRSNDGTIRVMASKFLEGKPKGPFTFEGMRGDDPNDVIPHEHRRELRGLYVVAAWLNHVDTKEGNNLDMFIIDPSSPDDEEAPRIGHLRHNLLDFGSALGSRHDIRNGTEYDFDLGAVLLRFFTFGIYRRPWQVMDMPPVPPSIGYYSIENFDPADWRANLVNPAFVNRTPRDGYWGAKIVMSFTDEQLEAAVRAGRYSDPEAVEYLLDGLRKRRHATGRWWFAQVSPLDSPQVEGSMMTFDDLWRRYFGGGTEYRWSFDWDAADVDTGGVVDEPRIPLVDAPAVLPAARRPQDAYARLRVWKVAGGDEAPRPAEFWLEWNPAAREWSVVGARY